MRWMLLALVPLLAGCAQEAPGDDSNREEQAAAPVGGANPPLDAGGPGPAGPSRHGFNGTVSYSRHVHVRNCPSQTIVGDEAEETLRLPTTDAAVLNLSLAWTATDPINERLRFRLDVPTTQGRETVATFDGTSPFAIELRERIGGQDLTLILEGPGCPAPTAAAVEYGQSVDVTGWWAAR